MPGPLIAIVGSADKTRQYDPQVNVELALTIAKELGHELAKQGCRLLVYGGSKFIESEVVKGMCCNFETLMEDAARGTGRRGLRPPDRTAYR
jgi:hypothetical protein